MTESQSGRCDSERLAWLMDWLMTYGMLSKVDYLRRPDGTAGSAWVLRRPFVIGGVVASSRSAGGPPVDAIDAAMDQRDG